VFIFDRLCCFWYI